MMGDICCLLTSFILKSRGVETRMVTGALLSPKAVNSLGFVDGRVTEEALNGAFGDYGDAALFRLLCYVGSWVVLANGFSIKNASIEYDWFN